MDRLLALDTVLIGLAFEIVGGSVPLFIDLGLRELGIPRQWLPGLRLVGVPTTCSFGINTIRGGAKTLLAVRLIKPVNPRARATKRAPLKKNFICAE